MEDKVNEVREAISDNAGPHLLAQAVVNRAKEQFPKTWRTAAITQLGAVMSIPRKEACMWVSEHCAVTTTPDERWEEFEKD